jgi:hypothetical protein
MSYFHGPTGSTPLVFGGANWIWNVENDTQCPGGGETHLKQTAQFSLPRPLQNPIMVLSGHGRQEQTGKCAATVDFEVTFTRTGD